MSSNWKSLADTFVHDLENKGYELVDRLANVAEEALEAVFSVAEEAEARFEEFKDQAAQGAAGAGGTFADLWKTYVDDVDSNWAVPSEQTLQDKAKEAYEYLMNNSSAWSWHRGLGYWESYYTQEGTDEYTIAERQNTIIREAEKHKAKA